MYGQTDKEKPYITMKKLFRFATVAFAFLIVCQGSFANQPRSAGKQQPQRIARQQAAPPVRQKRERPPQINQTQRVTPPAAVQPKLIAPVAPIAPSIEKHGVINGGGGLPGRVSPNNAPYWRGNSRQPAIITPATPVSDTAQPLGIRQPTIIAPFTSTRSYDVPGAGRLRSLPLASGSAETCNRIPVSIIENTAATDSSLQAEADLLREAYVTMSKAAHVYRGHRWLAMIQTARAGAILGIRLCGDGRGNNTRQISDQMLRDAKAILQRVHPMLVEKQNRRSTTRPERHQPTKHRARATLISTSKRFPSPAADPRQVSRTFVLNHETHERTTQSDSGRFVME
jgi:hypothetical protein